MRGRNQSSRTTKETREKPISRMSWVMWCVYKKSTTVRWKETRGRALFVVRIIRDYPVHEGDESNNDDDEVLPVSVCGKVNAERERSRKEGGVKRPPTSPPNPLPFEHARWPWR